MAASSSTPMPSERLSESEKARLIARQVISLTKHKLAFYKPHPKQAEFHRKGKDKHERILLAGNQQGKTVSGSAETTYHLTGLYPDWWEGFVFERPVYWWAAGVTNKKVRDVVQRRLMGRRGRFGTGYIPAKCIASEPIMSRGLAGLIDTVEIKHARGGNSILQFMSYDMDVEAWASDTLHGIWCDEEPPQPHYDEGLARLTTTNGIIYITVTPMKGASDVVRRFYPRPNTLDRAFVKMGLKDALHINPADHQRILSRYPSWQRAARAEGTPILGSGLVYETPEDEIAIPAFEIPKHWPELNAIDIGGGGAPTAWVKARFDLSSQTMYITHTYKHQAPQIAIHASSIKGHGAWVPTAWPHDAHRESAGDGRTYAQMYRDEGVNMLPTHAHNPDGSIYVEPSVTKLQTRMSEGRFKVFEHLIDWFDEYRLYHRKEGKIVKENDHLMDATRYADMMAAHALVAAPRMNYPETIGMDYNPLLGVPQ